MVLKKQLNGIETTYGGLVDKQRREKISIGVKKSYQNNPNLRAIRSKQFKELWNRPEYAKLKKEIAAKQMDKLKKEYSDRMKGKTWEQLFGVECAKKIRESRKTVEYSKKMSEIMKSKNMKLSDETKKKISESVKLLWKDKKYRTKVIKAHKKQWEDPEYRKKVLHRRTPSHYEQRIINMIDKNNLSYKFVGNGEIWMGRCNPDFINSNGKKALIEVYGTHQKRSNFGSIKKYEQTRTKNFKKYGFKVIFLNENDLFKDNWEEHCIKKIRQGE